MKKIKIILLLLLPIWGMQFFSACNRQQADQPDPVESIIKKHTVRFTTPPERIPVRYAIDAPLLGNGFTGIALSGSPEKQVFYVARNDFWRLKSALDESYPAVLGKIELSIPQLRNASYLVEQDLYEAISCATFAKDDFSVRYKTYLAATEDLLVVEIGLDGEAELDGTVSISHPGETEILDELPLERVFPDTKEYNLTPDGVQYLSRSFTDSVDIPTKAAMALRVDGYPDGRFTLRPGETVRIICAFSSNFKSDDCVDMVIRKVTQCTSAQLKVIEQDHKRWWKDYWKKSYVSIPDSIVEKQYYLSLYGMGACSRDLDFPPSIFGSWITKERPWWNGDYHLNYNHIAPYYALYSANRIEQADPYYMPLLASIPRGNYYSEKVTSVSGGILLPVGAGPLGIETTRRSHFMEQYFKEWIDGKNVEDEGLFWGQKSNSAYAVANMSMQFYRTWDKEYTRKVYPFVKGVATFWENYLTREGDRYVIYDDAIHEGTVGTKNPILSLGLVRMVMQTISDMSLFLGVDEDKRTQWAFIHDHLSAYPLQERNGKTVFRYTEKGTAWWDSNTLGIQHIYPAGQIGLDSDPELLKIAHNTIEEMNRWSDYNGSNSFYPAAVRVGYDPDSILLHLNTYSRHTYPNGFQYGNPHGIENLSTVPNTINEMLCMGHQDIVRVFPVWPRDKDASFHQIRVEGAFLVSAERKNGEVTSLTLFSEKGRDLTLQNPWGESKVEVGSKATGKKVIEGKYLKINTVAGETYQFTPVGANSSGRWVVWSASPAETWEDAFVTGNGRHGTMVGGEPADERIVCVHEELFIRGWDHHKETVPVTAFLLPEVRRLIDEGKNNQASHLIAGEADRQLVAMGARQRWPLLPHPAFDLRIQYPDAPASVDEKYRRQLDLETGVASVYRNGDEGVCESVFSSRTDNINVIRLKAGKQRKINTALSLEETPGRHGMHFEHNLDSAFLAVESGASPGWLTYHAAYANDPGGYEGLARVTLKGGKMQQEGSRLKIEGADEVLILVRITPLANGQTSEDTNARKELSGLSDHYEELLSLHSKEHREMFCRMQLDLGCAAGWKEIPTRQMLETVNKQGVTPLFMEQMHAMGRYLLISSCGKYPPPLQGIWGGGWKPGWIGGFVWDSNINLAISAASMGNLPECAESYCAYVERLLPGWRLNAKNYLGCRGFIVAHYNDPENGYLTHFGASFPWMCWAGGAGWNIRPFYEYAMLMGDNEALEKRVLPLYREMADFYEDFLVLGSDSLFHITPSVSPENAPNGNNTWLSKDATMDVAIAREVFGILLDMGKQFDLPQEERGKWKFYLERLPEYRINGDGALAEWIDPGYVDVYSRPLKSIFQRNIFSNDCFADSF